eukprot:CAMPEP_0174271780 /NCGR_PEP_ID=MMETSP0439-20130205/49046_1 /TAXON_ID=0 /ORGANISM="Stereomyxa ramosa, Strain Chinc5" /LENGTH=118 /DNA_ID=CAMNT_0015361991 /DNA_START=80 /DNA_END=433 /DNA_ORIENTATION=+
MPTNEKDLIRLSKKRHVGNDYVHIVYSEHSSDYRAKTITSQFNNAHIVIYPLENGLYRVGIEKKEGMEEFGPLMDGMMLPPTLLPTLARETAIYANCVINEQKNYPSPLEQRLHYIKE